jgi:hypothetical protein
MLNIIGYNSKLQSLSGFGQTFYCPIFVRFVRLKFRLKEFVIKTVLCFVRFFVRFVRSIIVRTLLSIGVRTIGQ